MNKSRRRWLGMVAAAVVIGLAGAAIYLRWFRHGLPADVRAAINGAGSWTLVSLYPDKMPDEEPGLLHGYKVLGRLPLSDPGKALDEVRQMDRRYSSGSGLLSSSTGLMCFRPRHALEGRMNGGRKLDLLICYQCEKLYWYVDGAEKGGMIDFDRMEPTALNDLLKDGGVPLPPPPE